MMAHILLEYSSDGLPPSAVDHRMRELGLARDGAFFALEAATEDEMRERIDRLHDALRGSGARYTIVSGEGGEGEDEIELENIFEDDGDPMENEIEEIKALLRARPQSFNDLLDAMSIDEDELEEALEAMVARGLVTAHRRDDGISYRLGGPMLRSMAR